MIHMFRAACGASHETPVQARVTLGVLIGRSYLAYVLTWGLLT